MASYRAATVATQLHSDFFESEELRESVGDSLARGFSRFLATVDLSKVDNVRTTKEFYAPEIGHFSEDPDTEFIKITVDVDIDRLGNESYEEFLQTEAKRLVNVLWEAGE